MPVIYQGGGSGTNPVFIPELSSDPVSPTAQTAWVLATPDGIGGTPRGLLLALTYSGIETYQLSYRTLENTTVRVTLI